MKTGAVFSAQMHSSKCLLHTHRVRSPLRWPTAFVHRRRTLSQPVRASEEPQNSKALAPVEIKTAVGKMLDYYLKMEPHLLSAAIDRQLEQLSDEKEAQGAQAQASPPPSAESRGDLTLYRRMDEVRQQERRASLEELMYICVLEKFVGLGVQMLPRLDLQFEHQGGNIKALTEGIHSQEALEMVKEQVRMLMGQATLAYDSAVVKMPKLQAVQMYVTSIMFGYFLRRVDDRFQLERSAGMFSEAEAQDEAVNRLERLFNQADSLDMSSAPDSPSTSGSSGSTTASDPTRGFDSDASSSNINPGSSGSKQQKGRLRQYVDSFGPETVQEMARVVSLEAATIIEMQSVALFGDYRLLQEQMEKAIGSNFISMEDLLERVRKEMESGAIESLTLTVGTQRRAILEAIAFGTFLRDVESRIDSQYGLLTAAKGSGRGPGGGPAGLAGAL